MGVEEKGSTMARQKIGKCLLSNEGWNMKSAELVGQKAYTVSCNLTKGVTNPWSLDKNVGIIIGSTKLKNWTAFVNTEHGDKEFDLPIAPFTYLEFCPPIDCLLITITNLSSKGSICSFLSNTKYFHKWKYNPKYSYHHLNTCDNNDDYHNNVAVIKTKQTMLKPEYKKLGEFQTRSKALAAISLYQQLGN